MTEIAPRADLIVNPITGESLSFDSPTADLAAYLADVRDVEGRIREVKRAVTRELLSRMDRSASWTVREAGLKVTGQSPSPVEQWDGAELRTALLAFVDAGALGIEAVDAAVQTVVNYQVQKKGVQALRKLGGEVAATVNRLAREVEPERRVSVSRA